MPLAAFRGLFGEASTQPERSEPGLTRQVDTTLW